MSATTGDTVVKVRGRIAGGLAVVLAVTLGPMLRPVAAAATSGTATITGGSVTLTPPATATFTATLTGAAQNVTTTQSFAVSDLRGSWVGWSITATSTQFVTGGSDTLPLTAVTVPSAPVPSCNGGVPCTVAVTGVSYPYTLPAAAGVAPAATKIFNATVNTGMLAQTVLATVQLAVPAAAKAGTYTSTWTYSLVATP